MMKPLLESLVQIVVLLAVSPLVSGVIKLFKARLQTRRGPGILQPYRDLHKLFRKGMVIPGTASWIFSATPYVVFLSVLVAGLMIPLISAEAPLSLFGGVLAMVYLLGLARFFLALGGLDTGSPFGGLGSSREMTISALAEPAMMLAIFTVAIGAGSTNLSEVVRAAIGQNWRFLAPAQMLACGALFIVLIAETGRIRITSPPLGEVACWPANNVSRTATVASLSSGWTRSLSTVPTSSSGAQPSVRVTEGDTQMARRSGPDSATTSVAFSASSRY